MTQRVWPSDLDLWGHVNNGVYLSLADLGRFDFMWRGGFFQLARKNKWVVIQGAATVLFRKPLTVFQRYQLTTRLLSWDEKWLYIESTFERGDTLIAQIVVRALARSREGNVPTSQILSALGVTEQPPAGGAALADRFDFFAVRPK